MRFRLFTQIFTCMNLQEFARETDIKLRSYERLYYDREEGRKKKSRIKFFVSKDCFHKEARSVILYPLLEGNHHNTPYVCSLAEYFAFPNLCSC